MNSYEILGVTSAHYSRDFVQAHEKLLAKSRIDLANRPDLLKLRKFLLDNARDTLLDPVKKNKLDNELKIVNSSDDSHPSTPKRLFSAGTFLYPFRRLSIILLEIFAPIVKYLYKWLVRFLRVAFVTVLIWFLGFSSQLKDYRDQASYYVNIMYRDIKPALPNIDIYDYLPSFLGGRYTYNSSTCEKIRLKVAAMNTIIEEEEKKSKGVRILGVGAALIKLAQGDSERAKRYGGEAARYASEIDHDVKKAKAYLTNVEIEHLECITKPSKGAKF